MNEVPTHTSASDIARRVAEREVSPVEVAQGALARLEEQNPVLNAFVSVRSDQALEEARALLRRLSAKEDVGPLAGVPIGIKDVDDVAGLPTTYGSVPFKDNVAENDSVHVRRLRAAGAIIIGKTNTSEFASTGFTKNLLFGITRSPWDRALTPGGSSGGSATAVVSGIVPLATGTDRGGSLRIPASYSGCFGMKPSFGRIPRGPSTMLEWSDLESIGGLCGTVKDYALYLDAVSGPHPSDPDSLPTPSTSFRACLERPLSQIRIAWAPAFGTNRCEPEVMEVLRSAVSSVADLGHGVDEIELPLPEDLASSWRTIGAFERYAELHHFMNLQRDDFGRSFVTSVERGKAVTPELYGAAQAVRTRWNRVLEEMFGRFDILLTPATPTSAFDARGRLPSTIAGRRVEDPLDVTPFTYPFNMSGHPAACVPAGLVKGLPVGMQVVGPRHSDDLVLRLCHAYEQARPWIHLWPPT